MYKQSYRMSKVSILSYFDIDNIDINFWLIFRSLVQTPRYTTQCKLVSVLVMIFRIIVGWQILKVVSWKRFSVFLFFFFLFFPPLVTSFTVLVKNNSWKVLINLGAKQSSTPVSFTKQLIRLFYFLVCNCSREFSWILVRDPSP